MERAAEPIWSSAVVFDAVAVGVDAVAANGTVVEFVGVALARGTGGDSSVVAVGVSLFFLYFREGRKRSLNDGMLGMIMT